MVIVAAISGSDLSREIIIEANELARAFDDTVHLVHAIEETEYTRTVERQSSDRKTDTGHIENDAAIQAIDGIEEKISTESEIVGRVGKPSKAITEYANKVDARYLVIGRRTRSPVGKVVFGSEAQSILLNTSYPVITVTDDTEEGT